MFSNFQVLLYNKLTDSDVEEYVAKHIQRNCYGDASSNQYYTFFKTESKVHLVKFMMYLYIHKRGYDIKPILKKLLSQNAYEDINHSYRALKKKYNDTRPKTSKRGKSV